jgi:hypothetical protein
VGRIYVDGNKEKWRDFLGTVLNFGSCKVSGISGIVHEVNLMFIGPCSILIVE